MYFYDNILTEFSYLNKIHLNHFDLNYSAAINSHKYDICIPEILTDEQISTLPAACLFHT